MHSLAPLSSDFKVINQPAAYILCLHSPNLTASSALPRRMFFCRALLSRLTGPVYSHGLPAVPDVQSRLLMSSLPPWRGSILVHSLKVTCRYMLVLAQPCALCVAMCCLYRPGLGACCPKRATHSQPVPRAGCQERHAQLRYDLQGSDLYERDPCQCHETR